MDLDNLAESLYRNEREEARFSTEAEIRAQSYNLGIDAMSDAVSPILAEAFELLDEIIKDQVMTDNPEGYTRKHRGTVVRKFEDLKRRAYDKS